MNLAAGVYALGVRSVDAAGNWSVTSSGMLTVVLPAPTGLSATSPTSNAPMLTWNAVPTAVSYRVYRQTGSGAKVLVDTVTAPAFTDSYVPGVYNYSVVAVNATGVSSAESGVVQVAVVNPTAPHANEVMALQSSEVVPGVGDVLPGLVSGSTEAASFDFDLGYIGANNAFEIKRNFKFSYDTATSHFLAVATNIPWLVVSGGTHALFEGTVDVSVGTAAAVSRPFTVDAAIGGKDVGRLVFTVYTDASRSVVLYKVNDLLSKGKIDLK